MCLFHHQIIVSQQNRLHIYIYTYHCNYTLCYMYNYVYYIKYGGVLFFWATPKSTRGRIFHQNHPAMGISAASQVAMATCSPFTATRA